MNCVWIEAIVVAWYFGPDKCPRFSCEPQTLQSSSESWICTGPTEALDCRRVSARQQLRASGSQWEDTQSASVIQNSSTFIQHVQDEWTRITQIKQYYHSHKKNNRFTNLCCDIKHI